MVDRALQVLTLHIMWKARSLPAGEELSPEEMQFRDKLKEERDSLLEKLVEFAVGTQSNTVEGVRRAVRCLMAGLGGYMLTFSTIGLPKPPDIAHPLLSFRNYCARWQ